MLSVHGMLDDWSMAQRRLKKRLFLALAGNRLLRGAAAVHCTAQAELEQARRWFRRYWTFGIGSGAHILVGSLLGLWLALSVKSDHTVARPD